MTSPSRASRTNALVQTVLRSTRRVLGGFGFRNEFEMMGGKAEHDVVGMLVGLKIMLEG